VTSSTVNLFSVRQLSPFTGNIQIISTPFARALSLNGTNWQIQVICESHQQQWNINSNQSHNRRFIIYGTWDKHNQLSRYPIDPMLDVPDQTLIENELISSIINNLNQLPFPANDFYELWLLDNTLYLPVALLTTTYNNNLINSISVPNRWRAGIQSDYGHPFFSNHSNNIFIMLESIIHQQTNQPICAQWFHRQHDRSGIGLSGQNIDANLINRSLTADTFPELIIKSIWDDNHTLSIIDDYLSWLSPRLLSLQHLSRDTRSRLENKCQHLAEEVYKYHRVYPEIINRKLINKLIVQTELTRSNS